MLAAAAALALALSAVQWLPGIQFLRASERGAGGYPLYSLGSLAPSWSVLFLLPYLLGGYGNFGLAVFSGPLNLPELSFGVGLLPLVAFISLLPVALRRHSPSRLGVWYVLAIGGVILALGTNTPVGHVLWHLPLYGANGCRTGTSSSPISPAVLVAYWADRLATTTSALRVPTEQREPKEHRVGGGRVTGPLERGRERATLGQRTSRRRGARHRRGLSRRSDRSRALAASAY